MKPLLARIDEELATCADPYRRAELLGERGCYWARLGRFRSCQEIINLLRLEFSSSANPTLLVWAMIVEGIHNYFDALSSAALDRVFRAHECARALKAKNLCDFGAAWLAHLEFERSNFSEVVRLAEIVDKRGAECSVSAQSRMAMVLGDVMQFSGDRISSKYWYSLAHQMALRIGDQAALGALMYNRASFSVANLRANLAAREIEVDSELLKLASMELASARAFERAIGAVVLVHLLDLSDARVCLLQRDFSGALRRFYSVEPAIDSCERRSNRSHVSGDIMYCELMCGRTDRALEMAIDLIDSDHLSMDVDDRVVLARHLVDVFTAVGHQTLQERAKELLLSSTETYEATIAGIERDFSAYRRAPRG